MSGAARTLTPEATREETIADRSALRWLLHDTGVVAGRNLRHFIRQRRLLVFSTIQPIMFVLLFTYVFGGAITEALPSGVDYIDFLLPGIFIQSTAFRTTQTSVGLAEDLERGVIDRFRSMPMSRVAVLAGRTVADLVRSLFVVVLMVLVGYLIGFRFSTGPVSVLGAIAVVSLFGFALSWIFAWLALVVPGAEAAQSASFVAIFPLAFASSVFVPIETFPTWLESVARYSPVTVAADATRALSIGGPVTADLLGTIAWSVVMLAVFVPAAVFRYRRLS
ncbi:MAG: ABC transporter permease [Actinobacteria bacterium]|nr:ABC transporter permease [Actinomycetota bacterium]